MSNEKQKPVSPTVPQTQNLTQGSQAPGSAPAFNGELPHNTKKEAQGPNTKR